MEIRRFKIGNYITIPGFAIVELGLSGNELLCYSLIYGFTQDEETEFHGSLAYVSSALNVTKQNAKKIIDRLVDRGLIEKREIFFSGVKFCHYVANRHGVAETATGFAEIATGNGVDSATNNDSKDIDINKDIDIAADGGLFPSEPVSTSIKQRGTTEQAACLFANSRYADFEKFSAEFSDPKFAGIDIVYYFHAVADWSAGKGRKMKDWIATARNFIRRDIEEKKLHRIGGGLSPDAIQYLQDMAD